MTSTSTGEVVPPGPDPEGASAEAAPQPGPAHRKMGPVRRTVREIGLGMITLGVIILLFVAYQLLGTGIAEAHSQANLKKQFNQTVAAATAHTNTENPTVGGPALPSTPPGGAIDHLRIPKIGVDKFVVQGVSEDDLRRGPGHYPTTVLPGEDGNAAIAGHRTTYGAPFFSVNELKVGDPIYITDLQGRTFLYKVSEAPFTVSPDNTSVLDPTPFAELTLTTCNPRFEATNRLIIVARLVGRALPVPKPVVTATPATPVAAAPVDNLGSGNSGAWPAAILYGLLTIGLWIGVRIGINRTRKWARLAAYVLGIAICLVPLWFCFENAVLLLPQSI